MTSFPLMSTDSSSVIGSRVSSASIRGNGYAQIGYPFPSADVVYRYSGRYHRRETGGEKTQARREQNPYGLCSTTQSLLALEQWESRERLPRHRR